MKDNSKLVTVYETGNIALIAVIKSLLDDANIKYFVKGENLQNLTAAGSIGIGYNMVVGPMEVQVEGKNKTLAVQLLKNVK
ncbi:MAG: DUF2007 domain-containing protein [Ignavibacteriaceae bacterium]|jgi:hypothetical protein